jgi:hypothetical protein
MKTTIGQVIESVMYHIMGVGVLSSEIIEDFDFTPYVGCTGYIDQLNALPEGVKLVVGKDNNDRMAIAFRCKKIANNEIVDGVCCIFQRYSGCEYTIVCGGGLCLFGSQFDPNTMMICNLMDTVII